MSEEYFKRVYAVDPVNAAKQSQQEFLDYAMGRRGLAAESWRGLIPRVVRDLPKAVSEALEARLHLLGNRALGEWSKDNNVRAFDEKPLRGWAEKLETARAQDTGDGSRIKTVIDEADKELASFIKKRGLPLI